MLRKVLVFGNGVGVDIIGNMIEDELPVEVIRVNSKESLCETESEMRERALAILRPYFGEVDVIVLASAEMTLAAEDYLRRLYPEQAIVGYGRNLLNVLKRENTVRILTSEIVRRMTKYQKMKMECGEIKVSERGLKNCSEAEINKGLRGFKNGLIVLYSTDLIRVKMNIQERVKWRATVVDMRESLFRDVCTALKLKGKDGRRLRELEG